MKTYKITTQSTCITEYTVEATSLEEAEEKYNDGDFIDSNEIDYQNESILTTEEI